MKTSFNSAIRDPFIRDLIKFAAVVIAVVLAAIGFKMLKQCFKK
jgi:hypothetical protein